MNQIDVKKLVEGIEEAFPVGPVFRDDDDWVAGYKEGKEVMRDYIVGYLEEYLK